MNTESASATAFNIMIKPRGAFCNLGCKYCYYLEKEGLYPNSNFRMDEKTLEMFTRQYLEAQSMPEVNFIWQGGEPMLMDLAFYQRAVALQEKYRKPGIRINNLLQTNGTRLDDSWCRFFKRNNFLVGLSLDGPRQIHNIYRLEKGGQPTFDKIMAGLRRLKSHQVEFNLLTAVHAANVEYPLRIYRFLRDQVGTRFIQFIPIVEHTKELDGPGYHLSDQSVTGEKYGQFLIAVFDEWIRRDVGCVFVQHFDVALGLWYGQPASLCVFGQTCGRALVLEHNGDLYACDHFVDDNHLLGNIQTQNMTDLVNSREQIQFGRDKSETLPRSCLVCDMRFACNGGCPKNRILRAPDGESGLNYLCEGYKAFFTHIDGPMKEMVNLLRQGRLAAEVMKL
jgi:uncharacterized protein